MGSRTALLWCCLAALCPPPALALGAGPPALPDDFRLLAPPQRPWATLWVEAEEAESNIGIVAKEDTYGGRHRVLFTREAPGPEGYFVRFPVRVPQDRGGRFRVFAACGPLGEGYVSPASLVLDGQPLRRLDQAPAGEVAWGVSNVVRWVGLGEVSLEPGPHTLELVVRERRAMDESYAQEFDAMALVSEADTRFPATFALDGLAGEWSASAGQPLRIPCRLTVLSCGLREPVDTVASLRLARSGGLVAETPVPLRVGPDSVGQTLAVAAELAVPFDAPSGDYELVLCGLRDASDQPAEAAIGAVTIQGRFAAPVTRPPRLGAPQLAGRGAARAGTTWSFGVAFTSMAGVPEPPRRLVVRLELGPHLCYLAESFAVPATSWRAGGKVELGPFALALPADLPAGEYGVQVALAGEPHAEGSPPNRAAGTLRVRGPATPESTTLKPLAYGTFVDSRGAAHPWYSTPSHALVWDGEPFLPVSGMFNGPYMSWARGPAEFAKLQANVEALRRHGLDHVYLYTQGTMEAMPAHCWEFLMDYLESQGMSYVIGYPGGSPGVDTAIDARPIRARPDLALAVEGVSLPGTASRRLTGPELGCSPKAVVSCLALALGADGRPYGPVDATPGPATDSDVEVTAPFVLLPAGTYRVLFLPRVHASFCCANPWGKADEQIEKAAAYLSRIRFRPGFRGFIDLILPNERGIYNEAESLFIEEPAFLEDRARWLAERHGSLDRLAEAWALLDAPPAGFATAAGLFPAYAGESLLLVGAAGPRVYRADAARSLFWYEYLEHRDESYARLQNRLCDAIRERVDVPITIKRCGVTERYHSNPNRADRGVDGAGYEIYASGDNLAPYGAGPGYAEMLQARKCMIGAATEFNRAFAEDGPANWPDVAAFFYDLAVAQHLGAKGTYLFLFDVLPHNYLTRNRLIEDSRMLEWMGLWKRILDSRRDEVAAHTPLAYTSWPPGDSWIPGGPVPASAARCARRTTRRGPSRPRPPTASGSCPSGTPRHRRR